MSKELKGYQEFLKEEEGMGTVEIILIILENQRHPNLMCFV